MNTTAQLVGVPDNVTGGAQYQQLAYLEAYDAVLNSDYAFVAYKETDSFGWRVRIKALHITGAVFEPDAMRSNARSTGAQGKPFFTWGNCIDPSDSDQRSVQYRVHVVEGKPSEVEIFVQLRKFDGSADVPRTVKFPWPA
ncbi:MAG: hypothetical protein IPJ85_05790 [Flavobacteriales bacterium]|nr:hypothetical protein [Flavobacteriales bacterium]